jgi:adrenodoxin-NADP+ reductase
VVRLRFLLSPQAFLPQESDPTSLGAVLCERTVLHGEPGRQVAVGTGELETLPATLALVSIGYKGVALPGTEAWFDERRGTLVHEAGRVDPPTDELGGLYAAGWLKRGPSGIIGTNINDAKETVATILHDLDNGNRAPLSNPMELDQLLKDKGVSAIDWEGVRRIYEYEYASRRSEAQPREKMTDVQKQIEVALKR